MGAQVIGRVRGGKSGKSFEVKWDAADKIVYAWKVYNESRGIKCK